MMCNGTVGLNTLSAAEDQSLKADRQVSGASMRATVRRIPTTTDGTFQGNSMTLGSAGATGDYLRKIQVEIGAGGAGGVWLSQALDPAATSGTTGSAIANATAQTFTAGPAFTATKNQYAGRIASFTYTPTGGSPTVFKSRIASHPAWTSTTTIAMTLEDTPPAGSAPTGWSIEGTLSRRLIEASRSAGFYEYTYDERSVAGGFILTIGASVIEAHAFGNLT